MYKKYICIGVTIDNIILGESKTPKILNIVLELEWSITKQIATLAPSVETSPKPQTRAPVEEQGGGLANHRQKWQDSQRPLLQNISSQLARKEKLISSKVAIGRPR